MKYARLWKKRQWGRSATFQAWIQTLVSWPLLDAPSLICSTWRPMCCCLLMAVACWLCCCCCSCCWWWWLVSLLRSWCCGWDNHQTNHHQTVLPPLISRRMLLFVASSKFYRSTDPCHPPMSLLVIVPFAGCCKVRGMFLTLDELKSWKYLVDCPPQNYQVRDKKATIVRKRRRTYSL